MSIIFGSIDYKLKITSRKLRNRKEEEYLLLAHDDQLKRKLVYLLQLYATLHFADEHERKDELQRKRKKKTCFPPATLRHFTLCRWASVKKRDLKRKEENLPLFTFQMSISCKEKNRRVAKTKIWLAAKKRKG